MIARSVLGNFADSFGLSSGVPREHRAAAQEGVVLLHGIGRSKFSMHWLENSLAEAGYATLNLDYPSRSHDIPTLAAIVHDQVGRWAPAFESVHFVTHSMGGLVARVLLARHGLLNLGRVAMLGPPNGGSEIADFLGDTLPYRMFYGPAGAQLSTAAADEVAAIAGRPDYPVGVVAGARSFNPFSKALLPGDSDGVVAVSRTVLAGMSDHVVLPVDHTTMVVDAAARAEVVLFLRTGRFSSAASRPFLSVAAVDPIGGVEAEAARCPTSA